MAIDRNTLVDVPSAAYVGKDGSVYVKDKNVYDPQKKYNIVKHTVIGRSAGNGQMYPNTNYKMRYPTLYEQHSGQKPKRHTLKVGLYASTLALAERMGLYDCLIESFGIENANAILDFCMYSISERTCVSDLYASAMSKRMMFSRSIWSPARLSSFFKEEFPEPRTSEFKSAWASRCASDGAREVWIAIDGSNNDCEVSSSEYCERDHSKSDKRGPVISYMYAVEALAGTPITITVSRGGMVDCKAVLELLGWLGAYGMKVRGAIIDRGFATKEVLSAMDEYGIEYVAMLKGHMLAHRSMLESYAGSMRMRYSYMLDRYETDDKEPPLRPAKDAPVLYGISSNEKIKLFSTSKYMAFAHLIYDPQNGGQGQDVWYRNVSDTARSLQMALSAGHDVTIPSEFKDCMAVSELDGKSVILVNQDAVQAVGESKGYYTLASSSQMTASEASWLYSLRNVSEEQYALVKSQLGADATAAHSDSGISAKLFISFIATILRNEMHQAAQKCGLHANRIIQELDQICINVDYSDRCFVCHTENQRQVEYLRCCGVEPEVLDGIADLANQRSGSTEPYPRHTLPEQYRIKEKIGHGGRPKGSKNLQSKKSVNSKNDDDPVEKKRPGRPKGAKNKKTIEKEEAMAKQRRKPGRPKGARNRPKPLEPPVKRKRGRPRKNEI